MLLYDRVYQAGLKAVSNLLRRVRFWVLEEPMRNIYTFLVR